MGVFFQLRVSVSGQHFAMGINIDPFAFGLFEQLFKVMEVMTADHYEGSFLYIHRDLRRYRIAEFAGVCAVQQGHAFEVDMSEFHKQVQPFLN